MSLPIPPAASLDIDPMRIVYRTLMKSME